MATRQEIYRGRLLLFLFTISHRVILLFFLPSTTIINNPDRSNSNRGVLVQIHAISTLFLDSILLLLLLTCTTLVSLLHVTTYVCTQQDDYFLPSSFPCKQQHHWRCIIIKMPSLSLSLTLLRISHSQTHFFCGALVQFTSWMDYRNTHCTARSEEFTIAMLEYGRSNCPLLTTKQQFLRCPL